MTSACQGDLGRVDALPVITCLMSQPLHPPPTDTGTERALPAVTARRAAQLAALMASLLSSVRGRADQDPHDRSGACRAANTDTHGMLQGLASPAVELVPPAAFLELGMRKLVNRPDSYHPAECSATHQLPLKGFPNTQRS